MNLSLSPSIKYPGAGLLDGNGTKEMGLPNIRDPYGRALTEHHMGSNAF